ncbi:receptor-type tyrosine-protein phosphatase F-like [Sycon ciliatum]|uniref:receptor-type tyrosine-protein phosphatase F-like n=1 Tax=Sycon ciliatum TaxID=27933 RepID=UPI0031F6C827
MAYLLSRTSVLARFLVYEPMTLRFCVTNNNSSRQYCSGTSNVTINGLTPHTVYSLSAYTKTGHLQSQHTAAVALTTRALPPPAPVIYYISATATSITFGFFPLTGYFAIGSYCCNFTRTSVSGIPGSGAATITICSATTTVLLKGAEEDAMYNVIAFAYNTASDRGNSTASNGVTTRAAVPAAFPTGLIVSSTSYTSVSISWTPISNPFLLNGRLVGYHVRYEEEGTALPPLNVYWPHATLSNLRAGYTYSIRVAAISTGGIGLYAPPLNRTTNQYYAPPPIISNVEVLATKVTVNISASPGDYRFSEFCCYFTRYSVSNIPKSNRYKVTVCNRTSPIVFSPVEEDASYGHPLLYCVVRDTLPRDGYLTIIQNFTTPATAPQVAPSDIQFRSSTATTVRISWSAVDPYELNGVLVGYNVTCWQGTNLITYVHTTTENANVTGLKFNSMYKVSVAAISSGGLGIYSKYTPVTTSQDVPPTPKVTSNSSTPATITVVFGALTGRFTIHRYCCLYHRERVSGTLSPTTSTTVCSQVTTIILKNLEEDATYSIEGFANNTDMEISPHTTPFSLETKPEGPSEPPASVSVTDVNRTSLSVVWNEVPLLGRNGPITHYLVKYNNSHDRRVGSDQLSLTLHHLQPNTDYNISVSAIGHGGQDGPARSSGIITTLEAGQYRSWWRNWC